MGEEESCWDEANGSPHQFTFAISASSPSMESSLTSVFWM
jgi:hypothetical protein